MFPIRASSLIHAGFCCSAPSSALLLPSVIPFFYSIFLQASLTFCSQFYNCLFYQSLPLPPLPPFPPGQSFFFLMSRVIPCTTSMSTLFRLLSFPPLLPNPPGHSVPPISPFPYPCLRPSHPPCHHYRMHVSVSPPSFPPPIAVKRDDVTGNPHQVGRFKP